MAKICMDCGGSGNLFASKRFVKGERLSKSFDTCKTCQGTGQVGLSHSEIIRILAEKTLQRS